jgi:predicted SprT family Zn-dependent metalloprotease
VNETVFEAVRPAPVLSLEAQLRATVEQCFRRAEAYLHHRFDRPHVLLNLRGMTAALADCTRNVLRFNRSCVPAWQLLFDTTAGVRADTC